MTKLSLYIVTWASKREEMEEDGWTLVKIYSLTGNHHPPSAIFTKEGVDASQLDV